VSAWPFDVRRREELTARPGDAFNIVVKRTRNGQACEVEGTTTDYLAAIPKSAKSSMRWLMRAYATGGMVLLNVGGL